MSCVFFHKWNGCKCTKCGYIRNEDHTWDGCKCQTCGNIRDEGHQWVATDEQCVWRCPVCGTDAPAHFQSHQWDENGHCPRCGADGLGADIFPENERFYYESVLLAAKANPGFTPRYLTSPAGLLLDYYLQLLQAKPFFITLQTATTLRFLLLEATNIPSVKQAAKDGYTEKYGHGSPVPKIKEFTLEEELQLGLPISTHTLMDFRKRQRDAND